MGFAIIRQSKIKGEEHFNGLAAHNKREYFSDNIVRERSHKNIVLSPFIYRNFQDFVASKKKLIFEGNKKNGTKNRMLRSLKNKKTGKKELPSMSQEFIFTHSPDALTEAQSIVYLKMAHEFLSEWFKGLEVLGSTIHLDEKTPHIHFDVTYFDLDRGKFCQKELQAQGKTDIVAIREAWDNYLVGTEFEHLKMQDGSVVDARQHQSKASLEIDALKKEIAELKKELAFYKNPKSDDRADLRGLAKHYHDRDTKEALRAKLERGEITEAEHTKELIALTKAKVKGKSKSRAPKPQKKR